MRIPLLRLCCVLLLACASQLFADRLDDLTKAAAEGNAAAQYKLGVEYANGRDVPKDDAKAVEWWLKAAAQGHSAAQFSLGMAYEDGRGVPKDEVRAFAWYDLASGWRRYDPPRARERLEAKLTPEQLEVARKLSAELAAGMPKK